MGLLNQESSADNSRRNFLIAGSVVTAGLVILKKFWPFKKPEDTTIKFLTRDGQLVEVKRKDLPFTKKKITTAQLKKWIWRTNPKF